ncbi:MAG: glutathione S-transferase [Gammaproteobacteria bacterium]|nr:glutathione S-transferase [Gammaproteobacteria bacterium]
MVTFNLQVSQRETGMPDAVLYQFVRSHYCEKARWTLDYKGVKFKVKNLVPGPHISQVRKIAKKTYVPVLHHNHQYIQGSDRIIDYLDELSTENSLTPSAADEAQQARQWEKFAETEIGVPLRLLLYFYLLDEKSKLIGFLAKPGPWYGALFLNLAYKRLSKIMRSTMQINCENAVQAKQQISDALEKIATHLQTHRFLAGDQFSRADMAVCSLLSPMLWGYELQAYGEKYFPEALKEIQQVYRTSPTIQWVADCYESYRR